jgi:hypothetical protein
MSAFAMLEGLERAVRAAGGRLLLVGGAVRDFYLSGLGFQEAHGPKDLDLLLFGLGLGRALEILRSFGPARVVERRTFAGAPVSGRHIMFRLADRQLDVSVAGGAQPLHFSGGALGEDAARRDFTVNSLYLDPLGLSLFDPLGGMADLEKRSLKASTPASFEADPLRLLRAFSLISRRGLVPHPGLLSLARRAAPLLGSVPKDRIWPEWRAWSRSRHPHLGLGFLAESGLIGLFPEFVAIQGSPQSWSFHPEGSVWNHTVLVVRCIARIAFPPDLAREPDRGILVLSALCHDLGKNIHIRVEDPSTGRVFYPNHAQLGLPAVRSFLSSIACPSVLARPVERLTRWHMEGIFSTLSPGTLRKMARDLAPFASLVELWALKSADWDGRLYWPERYPVSLEEFLEPVGGDPCPPGDLVRGWDVAQTFGVPEGPFLGSLLEWVRDAHDRDLIHTREEALDYLRVCLKRASFDGSPEGRHGLGGGRAGNP